MIVLQSLQERKHKNCSLQLTVRKNLGSKIWEFVPNNVKYSNSLSTFKKLVMSWEPEACLGWSLLNKTLIDVSNYVILLLRTSFK